MSESNVKNINFHSDILNKDMRINVYLPKGYEENNIFPAYYEVNSNKKVIEEIEAKLSNNKKIKHISSRKGGNPYELFFLQWIYAPLTGKNK